MPRQTELPGYNSGLTHSQPLHAPHLTGTVSGLRGLSFERPLSTTKKTVDQGNFFTSYFNRLHGKKLSHLAGCPGQVTYKKLARLAGAPAHHVNRPLIDVVFSVIVVVSYIPYE